jgi:hypothetical protein
MIPLKYGRLSTENITTPTTMILLSKKLNPLGGKPTQKKHYFLKMQFPV